VGEIEELCLGAMRALDDPICSGRILAVQCCAAALYSDTAHQRWTRGKTPGIDVLRRKIFWALNAYQRRLYHLGHPSGSRKEWAGLDSNQRPRDYEFSLSNTPESSGTIKNNCVGRLRAPKSS
jgi:hypothetical protein